MASTLSYLCDDDIVTSLSIFQAYIKNRHVFAAPSL